MTRRITVSELAELLGVSKQRVSELIAAGMPAEPPPKRGAARMLDSAAALGWMLSREREKATTPDGGESLRAAGLRKARADADVAELNAAKAANAVVELAEVEAFVERLLVLVATQLDGVAGRIAATVAAEQDPAACRSIIFDECRRVREALAAECEARAALAEGADLDPTAAGADAGSLGGSMPGPASR